MHKLYELKEKLINELEDYAENGKFSKEDVEAIKYTASAIDHICNICEDMEMESSYAGGSMAGGSYARGGRGGSRASYARGRGRNARRDSMGRYSREGGSYDGYSMGDDDFRMEIKELMQDAPNEQIRQKLQRIMSEM